MMNLDLITDIIMLLANILGMLACLYNYIEKPKKGWLFGAAYFFADLLSGYYWTTYTLVMMEEPTVSEFLAYFGWNAAYVVLLVSVIRMRDHDSKKYFHPVMLLPIPINLAQFFIYIQYGGIFNNIWQVGFTTVVLIFCCQSIAFYYVQKKKTGSAKFPYFHALALLYVICQYVSWTASCFDWYSDWLNPYYYFCVFGYIVEVFFAWGIKKEYENYGLVYSEKTPSEIRFQALLQALVSAIVFGGCIGGYYLAIRMKRSMDDISDVIEFDNFITVALFMISVLLGLLILLVIYSITVRHKEGKKNEEHVKLRRSKFNLLFTLLITFSLMVFAVIYNSRLFYGASVQSIYKSGVDRVENLSAELDNYLTIAQSTLNVTADTVDLMLASGETQTVIRNYIYDQTQKQFENFDENFTGLYALVRDEYMDGDGWVPPEGYDPRSRDWYKYALEGDGRVVIVPPYVDMQTGSVVITICKRIQTRAEDGSYNVVALDVIVDHIQELTEKAVVAGDGYALIVNRDGLIVAHHDKEMCGENITRVYGYEFRDSVLTATDDVVDVTIDDEEYTLFLSKVMDQWYVMIVVSNTDLFEEAYSQLAVNIIVSLTIFALISFFYFLGYRNEQAYGKKVEEMNAGRQKQEYEAEVLRLEKRSADEANKAKSNFLADMSHEIRTPINAILGMNEMILREAESDGIREYAGNIRNSGRNLLQLINSILDFSKIEDGKMEIVPVRYSLSSLLTYIVNSIQERAVAKNLEFKVNVDPKLPAELFGDDARINQCILNLLTNAVKYTPEGSVSLTISERKRTEDKVLVYVEVADTGIGIKESEMGKLFESFERLDVIRNRTIEGTGLGMSITTRLLDLMGSGLNVKSKYGEGSVFSFEIWQDIESSEAIGEYKLGRPEDDQVKYTESFHAPKASILLVDDTRMNILVVRNLLKKTGLVIDSVESGEEAIKLADEKAYDLILLDQRMPGLDGTETLKRIRALESGLNTDNPVICLTADAIRGAKERYLAEGFTDYLTKPVEGKILEKMLIHYLPRDKVEIISAVDEADETSSGMMERLAKAGFDTEQALVFTQDEEFYQEILENFVSEYDERSNKLRELYKDKKWSDYSVVVHALKSNARTIGAMELSEIALTMEMATKESDEDLIVKEHDHTMEMYESTVSVIKKILNLDGKVLEENDEEIMEFPPDGD
ncbi:MAG: response regulator [Lachnospiraceae bacterium]|nr:response regulator [Lachnospiraceae bacterium]